MKVALDTTVIISGLLWPGLPNKLLKLAKIGKLQLCTNPALLKELSNVLREDKPRESLPGDKALQNAPQRERDFFVVPKVIE